MGDHLFSLESSVSNAQQTRPLSGSFSRTTLLHPVMTMMRCLLRAKTCALLALLLFSMAPSVLGQSSSCCDSGSCSSQSLTEVPTCLSSSITTLPVEVRWRAPKCPRCGLVHRFRDRRGQLLERR
eukprot:m.351286 g.351286  ORF g.351286 m.351286 type:complete len:125 (+) comp55907_c0_seq21:1760-2134(+)